MNRLIPAETAAKFEKHHVLPDRGSYIRNTEHALCCCALGIELLDQYGEDGAREVPNFGTEQWGIVGEKLGLHPFYTRGVTMGFGGSVWSDAYDDPRYAAGVRDGRAIWNLVSGLED